MPPSLAIIRCAPRSLILSGLCLLLAACLPVRQPEGSRQVAAIEVPLETPQDRADLLAILHRQAVANGLHLDDATEGWRRLEQQSSKSSNGAPAVMPRRIYVGLWRGTEDDDLEVIVSDAEHTGRPWVTFLRGEQPALATKARVAMLAEIHTRWPAARAIPIMPNGALPLAQDLEKTATDYRVKPTEAAKYATREK